MKTPYVTRHAMTLTAHSFTPVLPPELIAKQTILLFRVDSLIKVRTPKEIKEEVHLQNDFAADMIDQVFKFPNNQLTKNTFKQTAVAQKALSSELKRFYIRIPSQRYAGGRAHPPH